MKSSRSVVLAALTITLGVFYSVASEDSNALAVTAPPESFFKLLRENDRNAGRAFYKKYIDVKGMPVVAAGEVADEALRRTHYIVSHLLAGRSDVMSQMVSNGMYLIIIGRDQVYTDMPEYRNSPNPAYLNERVRGTGGKPTSFGEENLLTLPIDRYDDESIGVHEFCHTIDGAMRSLDRKWSERKSAVFQHAREKELWKYTYAGSNPGEYWAEICQSYFDCNRINNWNHGPIGTRELLKDYDPEGYELVKTAFNLSGDQDWRYSPLQKLPNVGPPPVKFKINPYYTKFTWAREFTVLGRQASDEALLKANDTIRKMFAYRHDILKALIAEDLKLVVLGKNEKISDLPELATVEKEKDFDAKARILNYHPETKLLVIGEEKVVSSNSSDGECALMRMFVKALHQVVGTRPVDSNWDTRGRSVQQYELRVKRLDIQFDERLKQLHESATGKGLCKDSASEKDRVEYLADGVLAYFDAGGRPESTNGKGNGNGNGSPTTREALKEHDPDLYALVEQTMAYTGHQDWRYKP